MGPRGKNRPASLTTSVLRVFDLSLGEMLWSRRSLFLAVLVGGGVVLAFAIRVVTSIAPSAYLSVDATAGGAELFSMVVGMLYIKFVVPVLGVLYGTALIADEVDDRTITYLFVRPIQRRAVLFGKYLAYLVCTILLVLPSVVLVFFLTLPFDVERIGRAFPTLLADLGILTIGLAAYGAIFALVGARLTRPLVIGLVFAFGWEQVVILVPGYLKQLTIAYHLQVLAPDAMSVNAAASSIVMLLLTTAGALWLAGRAVERREYVLDQ